MGYTTVDQPSEGDIAQCFQLHFQLDDSADKLGGVIESDDEMGFGDVS